PDERAAELRPHSHGEWDRKQPVSCQPGTSGMNQREQAGLHDGKNRHGLSKAIDGGTPGLLEQQQDGGNQRARMADTDPPHKIDDGEAPSDGDGDAPDSHALDQQIANGSLQHAEKRQGKSYDQYPENRGVLGEHNPSKAVRYGAKGLAW